MEKYGVGSDIQHVDLRNREANLMQKIQEQLALGDRGNQDDMDRVQNELSEVRNKLTELDTKTE